MTNFLPIKTTGIIFIDQTSLVDWLTAIGTIGAVLVSLCLALYVEIWKPKRQQARFLINIDPMYSFSVDTSEEGMMQMANMEGGEEMFTHGKIRLRVEHVKGSSAKNVEILVSKIWYINTEENKKKPYPNFYPSNLLWSGSIDEKTTKTDFAPSITRFCDFGIYAIGWSIEDSWMLKLSMPNSEGDPAFNKFSNYLSPGKYEIELLISGENVDPTTSQWSLIVGGGWSIDEKEMFEQHCIIKRI